MGWEVHFRLSCVVFAVQPCPSGQAVTLAGHFLPPESRDSPFCMAPMVRWAEVGE